MRSTVQLKLDSAHRVRVFHTAHPDPNPAATVLVTRLDKLLAGIAGLQFNQSQQREAAREDQARRDHIEQRLRTLVAALLPLFRIAARQPGLTDPISVSPPRVRRFRGFVEDVSAAVSEAQRHRELLLRNGMPEAMLGELEQQLREFREVESRLEQEAAACREAVPAIESLVEQAYDTVRHLDALNTIRLLADPELAAAWRVARAVPWRGTGEASASAPQPTTAA